MDKRFSSKLLSVFPISEENQEGTAKKAEYFLSENISLIHSVFVNRATGKRRVMKREVLLKMKSPRVIEKFQLRASRGRLENPIGFKMS